MFAHVKLCLHTFVASYMIAGHGKSPQAEIPAQVTSSRQNFRQPQSLEDNPRAVLMSLFREHDMQSEMNRRMHDAQEEHNRCMYYLNFFR